MRRISDTSIVRALKDSANYACDMVQAAAESGTPGIGKTTGLQAIAEGNKSAILIHVGATKNTPRAAARLIADGLNIWTGSESTDRIWSTIESNLNHPAARERILLFDEAQNLPLAILKEVVDFPSRFGVPVLVCGNDALLKRQRVASAAFDQIAGLIPGAPKNAPRL